MIDSPAISQGRSAGNGIREFLRLAYRRKFIIFAPALLLAIIAWTFASTTPPRFMATAVLALDVRKVQVVEHEVVSRLSLESSAIRTELDVMRSRSINELVVDRLGLTADLEVIREAGADHSPAQVVADMFRLIIGRFFPGIAETSPTTASHAVPTLTRAQLTEWLLGNLKVSNDGRSLTILVSFTSESPERAARMANAIAENYLDDQVQTKVRATIKASDWLGQQLIKIRQQLEVSEAAVDDYRRKSGLLEVKGATIPAERLADLNAQLSSARAERLRAELKLQTARESGPESLPDVLASPTIQELRKELVKISSDIVENQDNSTFYKLKVLDARGAAIRKHMNQEMNRIVANLAREVQVARKKEAELAESFQAMQSQLGEAAHSGVRLVQLQREAEANRAIYQTFLARYKQTMEQESLAAPDARLISLASIPEIPDYPKKLRFLLSGMLGGLALGAGLAYMREGFDKRIRRASEVETVTGIPVFGILPKVSRWRGLQPQDYPIADPHSQFCTALVRINAALQAPNSLDEKKVILVTSAQPGDGKTAFCTGLARSLAKNQIRVLVIDADPYRPQVATAFGVSSCPAFDPIAEQRVRLDDIVQVDGKSAAHFVTAPRVDDLHLFVHSGGFAALLEEARQAYDLVIIDTPPVMTSADAALIGRFADSRLLLVRWGRTSWDEMTAAVGFLRLCRAGLDGIVIVGADSGPASYGQFATYQTPASNYRVVRSLSEVE